MKTYKKYIIILIISLLMLFLITNISTGTLVDDFKDKIDTKDTEDIKDYGGKLLGVIRVIGTIVSVGMIMVLGIKYMIGSAEERAEYKKTLLPYLIGAVLLFAATNIADVIYNWTQS